MGTKERGRKLAMTVALVAALGATSGVVAQGHDAHAHHHMPANDDPTVPQKVEGLTIPDVPVRTQDGRQLSFYSDLVEGKVVAVSFIFTTCTTICPPIGANFARLEKELGDRAGKDVHLISVSVDPVTDTPERLAAWAAKFGGGAGWTLVTGDKDQITRLLKGLQVFTPDFRDHSPTILVGNAARGEWTRTYGLAPPDELAKLLEQMAAPAGGSSP